MQDSSLSEVKQAISRLILKEPGVSGVGTGIDEKGQAAIIIHMDPGSPDARNRVAKLIAPFTGRCPIQYVEDGPYRKLPAS